MIYIYIYVYILQEKSTHFGLRVLTNFGLEVSGHFELYQVLMHNFFCVKMSRYSHYIYFLQEKSTHFHRRVL